MPERCAVFGCSNVRNKEKGIQLHPIPFYSKADSEKQMWRRKWINFVKSKRAHWEPREHSAVCPEHFSEEAYTNWFADDLVRRLKRDEIGVCVFPTKHARCVSSNKAADESESERSKQKVRYSSVLVSLPVETSWGVLSLIEIVSFIFLFINGCAEYCMFKCKY